MNKHLPIIIMVVLYVTLIIIPIDVSSLEYSNDIYYDFDMIKCEEDNVEFNISYNNRFAFISI